jgi:hypothetical protein
VAEVETTPQIDAYWRALGRFVTMFAQTEVLLQQALWTLADTPAPIAKAVFSGTRGDTAMSFIRRLAESLNLPTTERDDIEFVFSQLSGITKIRNDILHYGPTRWGEDQSYATISNRTAALTSKRHLREFDVAPRDLHLMTADLVKINMHIFQQFLTPKEQPNAFVKSVLEAPWLYKLPHRNENSNKPRSKERGPKSPRK